MCKCNEGYKLLDDKKTCVKDNDDSTNGIEYGFPYLVRLCQFSSVKNRIVCLSNIPENAHRDIREMNKPENVTISMNVKAPLLLVIWTLKFVTTQGAVINV